MIEVDEIPELVPPVGRDIGAMLADRDNRSWINAGTWTTPPGRPTTYDIIDRAGRLVDRVEIPRGRSIIGFGADGIVYLLAPDTEGYSIERARFR